MNLKQLAFAFALCGISQQQAIASENTVLTPVETEGNSSQLPVDKLQSIPNQHLVEPSSHTPLFTDPQYTFSMHGVVNLENLIGSHEAVEEQFAQLSDEEQQQFIEIMEAFNEAFQEALTSVAEDSLKK